MKIKTNFENNDSRLHLCRCCKEDSRDSKESTKSMKAQKIFLAITSVCISRAYSKLIFGNYIALNSRACFKLISLKKRDEEKKKEINLLKIYKSYWKQKIFCFHSKYLNNGLLLRYINFHHPLFIVAIINIKLSSFAMGKENL